MDEFTGLKKALLGKTKKVTTNPVTSLKEKQTKNMGVGILSDPRLIFVRKFRWTMEGNGLPEQWLTKVDIDFKKKDLFLDVFEVVDTASDDIDVQSWLEKDLSKESLTLTTYDGCGRELYCYTFENFVLIENKMGFDYAVSDPNIRKVQLRYKVCNREILYKKEVPKVPKKKFLFTVQVEVGENTTDEFVLAKQIRPNLEVEEVEVNFLGDKTWIPGKGTWQDISFLMQESEAKSFVRNAICDEAKVLLHLNDMSRNKLETWTLKQLRVKSFKEVEDRDLYEVVVKFEKVEYENHSAKERKNEC